VTAVAASVDLTTADLVEFLSPVVAVCFGFWLTNRAASKRDQAVTEKLESQKAVTDEVHLAVNSQRDALETALQAANAKIDSLQDQVVEILRASPALEPPPEPETTP
jgi:hypothetical protein